MESFPSWPVHNYWDSLYIIDSITLSHEYIFTSISKFHNSFHLSWAFHFNAGCFRAGLLLLVLMLCVAATGLFLSVEPAVSDIAWIAAFMASMAACMIAWVIAWVVFILSFCASALCECALLWPPFCLP